VSDRKPREEPPPAPYIRSASGTPARLKRTSRTDPTGRLWLYRLDYGDVVGTQEWTLPQLLALDGVRWLKRCPSDLVEREREPEPEAVGA
jgi:hypothetical protein